MAACVLFRLCFPCVGDVFLVRSGSVLYCNFFSFLLAFAPESLVKKHIEHEPLGIPINMMEIEIEMESRKISCVVWRWYWVRALSDFCSLH